MMVGLIALFTRSLRQTTRSGGTYLLRAGLAGGVLFALISAHVFSLFVGAPGLTFFRTVAFLNYFYLGLASCGFFATAVAEEKEEGTLGLLRMTNLDALSILLGKSTSRLCAVLLLISVQVPFVMVGVTMGGVSVRQILSSYALLGLFAFSAANFALLCSVYFQRVWSAAVATLVVIIGAGIFLPMLYRSTLNAAVAQGWLAGREVHYEQIERLGSWLANVSPFGHLRQITSGSFWQAHLLENTVSHLILGSVFFLLAWWMFDRRCQGSGEMAAPSPARKTRSSVVRTGRRRRPRLRAIAWKDFHFQYGGWRVVWLRVVGYALIAAFAVYGGSMMMRTTRQGIAQSFISSGMWVLSVELAVFVALLWSREHWGHTLGAIITLPRSLLSVLREKLQALLPALLPSLGLVVVGLAVGGAEWAARFFQTLLSDDFVGGGMFALPGMGFSGILRWLLETIWYLHLVAYLSLRLRWTALPAAYGIATGVSMAGYVVFFWVTMLVQGGGMMSGTNSSISNPLIAQSLVMSALYAIGIVFLFPRIRNLILTRAAEG